jgi:hypothetical protein
LDVTWTRKRPLNEGTPLAKISRPLGFSKNAVGMPGEPQFGASSDTEIAIGNSRKVRRRGSLACRAVGYGSVAAALFCTLPVQAADEVTDLLVQVKKQLEQSQRQMEQSKRQLEQSQKEITALKQQVEVLTKRVAQTPRAPAAVVVPARGRGAKPERDDGAEAAGRSSNEARRADAGRAGCGRGTRIRRQERRGHAAAG